MTRTYAPLVFRKTGWEQWTADTPTGRIVYDNHAGIIELDGGFFVHHTGGDRVGAVHGRPIKPRCAGTPWKTGFDRAYEDWETGN